MTPQVMTGKVLYFLLLRERLHAKDRLQLAGGESFQENGTDRLLQHLAPETRKQSVSTVEKNGGEKRRKN